MSIENFKVITIGVGLDPAAAIFDAARNVIPAALNTEPSGFVADGEIFVKSKLDIEALVSFLRFNPGQTNANESDVETFEKQKTLFSSPTEVDTNIVTDASGQAQYQSTYQFVCLGTKFREEIEKFIDSAAGITVQDIFGSLSPATEDPNPDPNVEDPRPLPNAVPAPGTKIGDFKDASGATHTAWRPDGQFKKTFFYSKPERSSANRLDKLPRDTTLLALDMNIGKKGAWHKVKVQDGNSKDKIGFVLAAHTRPLPMPGKTSPSDIPKAVVIESVEDLRPAASDIQASAWKTRDRRPILNKSKEEISLSTYEITVITNKEIVDLPDTFAMDEQFKDEIVDGVSQILKFYNKDPFETISLTEDIGSMNDAYKALAEKLLPVSKARDFHLGTSTPNGKLRVLVTVPARHIDGVRERLEDFAFDKETASTAYPITTTYGFLKDSIRDMTTKVLPHYATAISNSGMKVVFDSIPSGQLDLSKEINKLDEWMSSLNEYLLINDFDYKIPIDKKAGMPVSDRSPGRPKNDDIIEIGFAADYRILYILFNGQPLRTGFNWFVGTEEFPGETPLAERRTNQFAHMSPNTTADFGDQSEEEKTPWTEWVKKNVYIHPKIKPSDLKDDKVQKIIEKANSKSLKTQKEVEEETSFFSKLETRKLMASEAAATYTETYDAVTADIDRISKKIDSLETAYYLLANKYGLDPLVEAIMYCLMQKIPNLEELMYKLGLSHLYKDLQKFIAFIEDVYKCVPWQCLVSIMEESFELVYEKYDEPLPEEPEEIPEASKEIVKTETTEEVIEVKPAPPTPPPPPIKGDFNTKVLEKGDGMGQKKDKDTKVKEWQKFLSSQSKLRFTDATLEGKSKEYEIPIVTLSGIKKMPDAAEWADQFGVMFMDPQVESFYDKGTWVDGKFGNNTKKATQTLSKNLLGIGDLNENMRLHLIFSDNETVSESEFFYAQDFLAGKSPTAKASPEKVEAKVIGAAKETARVQLGPAPPEKFFISQGTPTQAGEIWAEYTELLIKAHQAKTPEETKKILDDGEDILARYIMAMSATKQGPVIGEGVSFIGQKEQTTNEKALEQAAAITKAKDPVPQAGEESCDDLRAELDDLLTAIVDKGHGYDNIDDWPGDDWLGEASETHEDFVKRVELRNKWTECVNKKIERKVEEIKNPPKIGEKQLSGPEKERIKTEYAVFAFPKTVKELAVYLDATGKIPEEFALSLRMKPNPDIWSVVTSPNRCPIGADEMRCFANILAKLLPKEVVELIIRLLAFLGILRRFSIMTHGFNFSKMYDPDPDFMAAMEKIVKQALEEALIASIKEITKMLKDACADKPDKRAGAVNLSDAFGKNNPNIDPAAYEDLQNRLAAVQGVLEDWGIPATVVNNPELSLNSENKLDFFEIADEIAALLTPAQFCSILEGNPSLVVKHAVMEFVKELYPEFYKFFLTPENLIEFLAEVGNHVDPSFCFEDYDPKPAFVFEPETGLCNVEAIAQEKQTLIDKGMTEEQAQAQVDKDIRDRMDLFVQLDDLRNPDPPDVCNLTKGLKANLPSLQRQLEQVLRGLTDNIKMMFGGDVGLYVPLILKDGNLPETKDLNQTDMENIQGLLNETGLTEANCDLAALAGFLKEALGSLGPEAPMAEAIAAGQDENADVSGILSILSGAQDRRTLIASGLRNALASSNNVQIFDNSGISFIYPNPNSALIATGSINSDLILKYSPEKLGKSAALDEYTFTMNIGSSQAVIKNASSMNEDISKWIENNLDFTNIDSSKHQDMFADYIISKGDCNLEQAFGQIDDPSLDKALRTDGYEAIMQLMIDKIKDRVLESDLFFSDIFSKLTFAPDLEKILDECGVSPTALGEDGAVDLLRLEELIKEAKERFTNEALGGCSLVSEDDKPGPLEKIITQVSMLLLIRTFIIENTMLGIFSIAANGLDAFFDDTMISICYLYYKEYCKKNGVFAKMKTAAQEYTDYLKNQEVYIPVDSGEECLKWLFKNELGIIKDDFDKVLKAAAPSVFSNNPGSNPGDFWDLMVEPTYVDVPALDYAVDRPADWPTSPVGGAWYDNDGTTANIFVDKGYSENVHLLNAGMILDDNFSADWYFSSDKLRMETRVKNIPISQRMSKLGTFILEPYIKLKDQYDSQEQEYAGLPNLEVKLKKLGIDFERPPQFRSEKGGPAAIINIDSWQMIAKQITAASKVSMDELYNSSGYVYDPQKVIDLGPNTGPPQFPGVQIHSNLEDVGWCPTPASLGYIKTLGITDPIFNLIGSESEDKWDKEEDNPALKIERIKNAFAGQVPYWLMAQGINAPPPGLGPQSDGSDPMGFKAPSGDTRPMTIEDHLLYLISISVLLETHNWDYKFPDNWWSPNLPEPLGWANALFSLMNKPNIFANLWKSIPTLEHKYLVQNYIEENYRQLSEALSESIQQKKGETSEVNNFLAIDYSKYPGGDFEDPFEQEVEVGMRLSYVIPTIVESGDEGDDKGLNIIKQKINGLYDTREQEFPVRYSSIPKLYKETNLTMEGPKDYYVIPLLETEKSILGVDCSFQGLSLNEQGSFRTALRDSHFDLLINQMKDSQEFKALFHYMFPQSRFQSLVTMYTMFGTRKIKHMDTLLSSTKKAILATFNLAESGAGYAYESPLAGKYNDADDPNKFNLADYDLISIILKMIIKTPLLIVKGVAETCDPNIIVANKIVQILKLMLKMYKLGGGCTEQVEILEAMLEKLPFPLLSIGLLPSALPYGVGFPPPPVGPGIGPPMTMFGLAYNALGLYNDGLMKTADQIAEDMGKSLSEKIDPPDNASNECENKIEELLYSSGGESPIEEG